MSTNKKDLSDVLAYLCKFQSDPRLGEVHREGLAKLKREVRRLYSTGKSDRKRVKRVIELLCGVLVDAYVEPLDED